MSDAGDGLEKVIAPLLIIQRVANKSALTKNTIVSGRLSSVREESTGNGPAHPGVDLMSSMDGNGVPGSGELEIGIETAIVPHQDKV